VPTKMTIMGNENYIKIIQSARTLDFIQSLKDSDPSLLMKISPKFKHDFIFPETTEQFIKDLIEEMCEETGADVKTLFFTCVDKGYISEGGLSLIPGIRKPGVDYEKLRQEYNERKFGSDQGLTIKK
jgi:hypothetical protein